MLECVDDELLSTPVMSFYGSTLGGHLRHCIEHYESFITGLVDGRVDYDKRSREKSVERQTKSAREKLLQLVGSMEVLKRSDADEEVLVKMDCGGNECVWQKSTVGRELQFLVSHTVHHFAMMKGLCSALNVRLPETFGVAPSTLRHEAKLAKSG